jgi:hypothetical protein
VRPNSPFSALHEHTRIPIDSGRVSGFLKQLHELHTGGIFRFLNNYRLQKGAAYDDPRDPLGGREERDEQPHRKKRSSPLFFDHGKYGNCHCYQCGFL